MTPLLLSVTIAFTAVLAAIAMAKRRRANFEKRFPPISDAEFVARCGPGTNPAVALKVRRIVADHSGVEYERVHPEASFVEDLGLD